MTDITAEEYDIAFKVAMHAGHELDAAAYAVSADRLRKQQARDTEAEQLAEIGWDAAQGESVGSPSGLELQLWKDLPENYQREQITATRAILDHLAKQDLAIAAAARVTAEWLIAEAAWMASRLAPDNGITLTADEAADVRQLWAGVDAWSECGVVAPEYRSRDDHHGGNWWWWNQKEIRYSENECGHPRASKTREDAMLRLAPFTEVSGWCPVTPLEVLAAHRAKDFLISGAYETRCPCGWVGVPADHAAHVLDALTKAEWLTVARADLQGVMDHAKVIEKHFELRGKGEVSGNVRQITTPIAVILGSAAAAETGGKA